MLRKMLWISNFLFVIQAMAQISPPPMSEFMALDAKSPIELKLLAKHLSQAELDYNQQADLINYSKLINEDLLKLSEENSIYLFKTEIYRNILKAIYLPKKFNGNISSSLISSVQERVKQKQYTEFTKWLINFILEDFKFFIENGLIDKQEKISRYDSKNALLLQHFKKKVSFLGPWLAAFEKLPPNEFHQIITLTGIGILKAITAKSYYFKGFSTVHGNEPEVYIFKVPGIEIPKPKEVVVPEAKSLEEIAKENKEKAQDTVKDIAPEDMSNASGEIDKIIGPEKKQWKPK